MQIETNHESPDMSPYNDIKNNTPIVYELLWKLSGSWPIRLTNPRRIAVVNARWKPVV